MYIRILQQKVTGPVLSSADWVLCPEELASKFNSRTKAIIINNPNNPLGKVSFANLPPEFNSLCFYTKYCRCCIYYVLQEPDLSTMHYNNN